MSPSCRIACARTADNTRAAKSWKSSRSSHPPNMVTIAVDAMGGDNAPKAEVEGAVEAARTLGIRVILVGRQEVLRREVEEYDDYRGFAGGGGNAARAVRAKRDSSVRVASRLVRDGIAQGFVSAGNTGAVMATAKMVQGVIHGVDRPALAGIFPTLIGKPVVVIDVGANVDCSPRMLAQFAVMGEVYSRVVLHQPRPKVGLLSIGEEEHKGNDTTRGATPLLKSLPIDFVGNLEGRDIYTGKSDVIVCDGFIGNVALKVSEGLVDMLKQMLQESLRATITRQIGSLLARAAFTDFKKRVDYSEYGGAPLYSE